jgi:diguanylate cyclase (GGDEF)-like protein
MHHHEDDVLAAGRRVRRKICAALAISAVIPLLVLAYTLYAHLMPMLDPIRHARELVSIQALLVFTGLLMAAGAFVIWDLAVAVSRMTAPGTTAEPLERAMARRSDEIGTLMGASSRMLTTIEEQASQINDFTSRLERAYRELEFTNARLREVSFRDEVTGLYNRRFFSVRLEEEVSRYRRFGHPVSVVLLDVDGFKEINDAFGHAAGDDTLHAVGQILLGHSRGINVICRYGGDEFAVLLVESSKEGALCYAERIRQILSTYVFSHGRPVSASFGIAALPEDVGTSADDLMRAADDALYAAKRGGKGRAVAYGPASTPAPHVDEAGRPTSPGPVVADRMAAHGGAAA